jgi:hypothetical protein
MLAEVDPAALNATALNVACAIVVIVAVLCAAVSRVRRRRDRRLGLRGDGRWWEGPYAPPPPPMSAQRREDSGSA